MKDLIAADYTLRTDGFVATANTYTGAGTYIAQVDGANGSVTLGEFQATNNISCELNVSALTNPTSIEWLIEQSNDNFATIAQTDRKFITEVGLQTNMIVGSPDVTGTIKIRYSYIIVGAGSLTVGDTASLSSGGHISIHRP